MLIHVSPKLQTSSENGSLFGRRLSIDQAVDSIVEVEVGWRKSRRSAKVPVVIELPGRSSNLVSSAQGAGAAMPELNTRFPNRFVASIERIVGNVRKKLHKIEQTNN